MREAFENLRGKEETYGYYIEAQTRQYADWIVGMNGSPLISILINKNYNYPKFEVFLLVDAKRQRYLWFMSWIKN